MKHAKRHLSLGFVLISGLGVANSTETWNGPAGHNTMSGKLGIGTTPLANAPDQKVTIGIQAPTTTATTQTEFLFGKFYPPAAAGNYTSRFRVGGGELTGASTNNWSGMEAITKWTSTTANKSQLGFFTGANGAAPKERLTILHDGKVGIGINAPTSLFQVQFQGSAVTEDQTLARIGHRTTSGRTAELTIDYRGLTYGDGNLVFREDRAGKDFLATSFVGGKNQVQFPNGNVGIGFATNVSPVAKLDVNGTANFRGITSIGGPVSTDVALTVHQSPGLVGSTQYGIFSTTRFTSAATTAGNAGTFRVELENAVFTQGTSRGVYILNPTKVNASAAITTAVGLDIEAQTAGSTNYAIRTNGTAKSVFGGNVGIGTTTPEAGLHIQQLTPGAQSSGLTLENPTSTGHGAALIFKARSSTTIQTSTEMARIVGSGHTPSLSFYTRNGSGALEEQVVIGQDNTSIRNRTSVVGKTAGQEAFVVDQLATGSIAQFRRNGQPKVVIDEGGNVGINTSQPGQGFKVDLWGPMRVYGSSAMDFTALNLRAGEAHGAKTRIVFSGDNNGDYAQIVGTSYGTGSPTGGTLIFRTRDGGTESDKMRDQLTIKENGRFVMGSPGANLPKYDITPIEGSAGTNNGNGSALHISAGASSNQAGKFGGTLYLQGGDKNTNGNWGNVSLATIGGQVAVGTDNPDPNYKVDIRGHVKIVGDVTVASVRTNSWSITPPDYVFEKDYDLKSLEHVEKFVKANKHLPEIPSAKEMNEKGLDLTEMNFRLLKKVEELTLHAIRQEKEIRELRSTVQKISRK